MGYLPLDRYLSIRSGAAQKLPVEQLYNINNATSVILKRTIPT